MKKMNKKGFTLVEIMIVVAIIGLLAAIGIPSFKKARETTLNKTKESNVRLVIAAAQQYAIDENMTSGTVNLSDLNNYIDGGVSSLTVGSSTVKDTGSVDLDDTANFTINDLYN